MAASVRRVMARARAAGYSPLVSSVLVKPESASQALPPSRVLGFAVALSLATMVLCLELACGRPDPGIDLLSVGAGQPPVLQQAANGAEPLEAGTAIAAIGVPGAPAMALRGDDLSPEPDVAFAGYKAFNRFFERQQQLSQILAAPEIELITVDGRVARLQMAPHRALSDLPFIFWLQLVSAIGCWLTGAAIFAFRPEQDAAKYCGVAGFGVLLMAASAAVYSSRELALPGHLFRLLSATNHFGALFNIGAFTAVLWHYPQALGRFRPGRWLLLGYTAAWAADFLQLQPFGNMFQAAIILCGYAVSLVLAAVQWRAARGDPLRRAALQWFILSWFVGSGAFLALVLVPAMAGMDSGSMQAYGFGFLLLVSIGIALGISRYRLFDLETWWFRAVMLVVGGFSVVVLDVVFAATLHFEAPAALAASLILAGWMYFPARQWLMSRFLTGARRLRVDDVPALLRDVLAPNAYAVDELLPEALRQLYNPLSLNVLPQPQDEVAIAEDGLALRVPGIGSQPAWEARFAGDGQRLFTRRDAEVASAVRAVLDRVAVYQVAVERGIEQERARVAQDLHDDIGARLLTLLHRSEGEAAQSIREVLASLRLTVYGLGARPQSIANCLAHWRAEAGERCEASGVHLEWRERAPLSSALLDAPQQLNLARVIREALSNALRHAHPTRVEIEVAVVEHGLEVSLSNDGATLPPEQWRSGLGLRGMDHRMQRLGGSLSLHGDEHTTRVALRLPLN
ncbi:MAG TPA: ATP-binding protein [Nevskia sp.]|nr:ATP-binding protein [Nevskia sp.]